MKETFIPLDYDYIDVNDKAIIRVWGRTKEGKKICIIDETDAYFWVIPQAKVDLEKFAEKVSKIHMSHAGRNAKVLDVQIKDKNFLGEQVRALQVFVNNSKDITAIKDVVKEFPETKEKKEQDINFVTRYIIDKEVKPLTWQNVEGKEYSKDELKALKWNYNVDIVLKAEKIEESKEQPEFKPNVLAFDIEVSDFNLGKGKIVLLSVANNNLKKVLTWKHFSNPPKEVEFVKNEEELIKRFIEIIRETKPDCITGYFSDAFDLPYL